MRSALLLILTLTLAVLPLAPAGAQPAGKVFDDDPATTERIDVEGATATSVGISQLRWEDGEAAHVVLSRDDDFVDALAAAPLSARGPLLFTPRDALPEAVREEIARALDGEGPVYVLGGNSAVSDEVVATLAADGHDVRRLAGQERVETAVRVAEQVVAAFGSPQTVAIARAFGPETAAWADSVTGGALAASRGIPLLVTPTERLDPLVTDALARFGAEESIVLGGRVAVADEVVAALPAPTRVFGAERNATAYAIATELWPATDRFLVIHGYRANGWQYGLAAAGLAADLGAPLLVAGDDFDPPGVLAVGGGCGTDAPAVETALVGSVDVLSDAIREAIDSQDGGPCPATQIVLQSDGLGADLGIGTAQDTVLAALEAALGPPTFDSGWTDGCELEQPTPQVRAVEFADGLTASFREPDAPVFDGWAASADIGLATDRGVGLGDDNATVSDAYGADGILVDNPTFGPFWDLEPGATGELLAFVSGTGQDDVVVSMFGGNVRFCE